MGKSLEQTAINSDHGNFRRDMTTHGIHAKGDVVGVQQVADLRAGFMRMHEQESDRVSLGSVAADRVKSTLFEGLGSDSRLGSSQTPAARLQVGVGAFEESSRIASIDGARLETSRTSLLGARTAASVGGSELSAEAGCHHVQESQSVVVAPNGLQQTESTTTSSEGLYLKGNLLGVAGFSSTFGSKKEFQSVETQLCQKKSKQVFSEKCLHGVSCTTSLKGHTSDWSTGREWRRTGSTLHEAHGSGVAFAKHSVTDECVAFRDKVIGYALADETQQKETRRVVDTYGVETSKGSKPLKSLERTMEYEMNLQTGQSSTAQTVTQTSKAGYLLFVDLFAVMGVFESDFHYL